MTVARPSVPRGILGAWLVFATLPLLAAGIAAVIQDARGIGVGIVGACLIVAPSVIPGLRRTPWLLRLVLAIMIGVQFPAEALLLYQRTPPIDKLIHFTETGAMALGLGILARLLLPQRWAGWGVLVTAFAAIGLSATWEIVELASDVLTGTRLQIDNLDTMTDLVADTIGAFVWSLATAAVLRTTAGRFLAADFLRAIGSRAAAIAPASEPVEQRPGLVAARRQPEGGRD